MNDLRHKRDMPAVFAEKLRAARASRKMAGERRVITMLFCDVVGSATMAEQLDPEEWAEIMDDAFDFLIAPIFRYEGTLARLMGDAILAFFGAPIAHEDDPQRAILAGLDIIREIGPFSRRIQAKHGLDFKVRVGINTGPVVVGEIGSDLALEYTAMGDAINLAARMEETAAPGTVQIAEDTHKLVAPLFELESLGLIELKGKTEPVQAYRVLGQKHDPGRLRGIEGLETPLIGREQELKVLQESLAGLDQQGKIIFLMGEAGLGKSRLIDELYDLTTGQDGQDLFWLKSQSVPYEVNHPYSAVIDPMREMLGIKRGDSVETIKRKIEVATSQMEQEKRLLSGEALKALFLGRGGSEENPVEAEAVERALFEFVTVQCMASLRTGRGVLVFDDLHWADAASTEMIIHLFQLVEQAPVLILCALRPYRESAGWRIKETAVTQYQDKTRLLRLLPLSDNDSDALVDSLLSIADLPNSLRRLILKKAEGNPFFVEEVARSLIDRGIIARDETGLYWRSETPVEEISIPDNLQGLLISRIDRLEKETRRILQLASVIGRSFYEPILEAIVDRVDDLAGHLASLQAAELILEAARLPEVEYKFRHELTRDAAYRTILRRERKTYHLRVAKALEKLMAGRINKEAHRVAYHYREAGRQEKALHYYALAGESAAQLFANDEADNFYRQAQFLAREIGDIDQLIDLYTKRGRTLELDGRYDEAVANYVEMADIGEERAEPRLRLESLLARALLGTTYTSEFDPEGASELIAEALALAEELNNQKALAKAYWIRSLQIRMTGEIDMVLEYSKRSLNIARKHNLLEQEAYTLHDMSTAFWLSKQPRKAIDGLEKAGEIFEELNNLPMLVDNRASFAVALVLFGQHARARVVGEEALALSWRIGSLWGEAYSQLCLGMAYFHLGLVGLAMESLSRSLQAGEKANFTVSRVFARYMLIQARLYFGDEEGVESELAVLEEAAEEFPNDIEVVASVHLCRLLYYLEIGHTTAAREVLERLEKLGEITLVDLLPGILITFPDCRLRLMERDFAGAIACADRHIEFLESMGVSRLLAEYYRLKGEALFRQNRYEDSGGILNRALEVSHESQTRVVRWQIRANLAEVAETTGRKTEAEKERQLALDEVQYILDHIGSDHLRTAFLNKVKKVGLRIVG